MYLLADLKASNQSNKEQTRDLINKTQFITSAQSVFDALAELDIGEIRTFCSKIHTHELSHIYQASSLTKQSKGQHLSYDPSHITKIWNHASTMTTPSHRLGPLLGNSSLHPTRGPLYLQSDSELDNEIESNQSSLSLLISPTSTSPSRSASTNRCSMNDTFPTTSHPTSPFDTVSEPSTSTTRATSISPLSTTLGAPLLSPSSNYYNNSPSPPLYDIGEANTDLDSPVLQDLDSHRNPKRWPQALKIMTLTFGSNLSQANLTKVIQAGDGLVRNDAISFLRNDLLQWKGMWDPSDQLALLSNDSVTDHFVKISQTISILDERSVMDRIRLLLYRVLLYQYYISIQLEVKESQIRKQQGVGIASFAVEFLLKHLYNDYLDLTDKKRQRKRLLHRQIRLGKRLTRLSGYLGLGILLSASPEAMVLINNTKFSDDMDVALVCYATNAFPELPKLGKALDRVVRHIVKNRSSEEMRPYVESLLPDIQRLLDSQCHPLPISTLVRFDQEVHRVEVLKVFSEATLQNPQSRIQRPRTIEVDLHLSRKRCRSS